MNNHMLPKIIISAVCIAAVAVIMSRGDETSNYTVEGTEFAKDEAVDGFVFEPETISYNGIGDLDLRQGVSLPGFTKHDLDNLVYVKIRTAGALSDKRVEYMAEKEGKRYRSVRDMHLTGYTGPKITMPQHIPDVTEEKIDSFGQLLLSEEDFKVDDGFGNDASTHMEVAAERSMTDSSLVHYSISIENVFGDRDRVNQDVILSGKMAVLALTDAQVFLKVGQIFEPRLYIARAETADGVPAMDAVKVSGNIDTSSPGFYEMTYYLDDQQVRMTVVVE